MAQNIDIIVPDLGDFANVEVIEILVAVGDTVERETGLITVETDKAAMDIPSPENGVIVEISVAVGDTVSSGDVIGKLSIEVTDTVVIAPKLMHEASGDTTVLATPARAEGKVQKSGGVQTLVVPDLGDFESVEVIEVHISKGDEINAEDPLITLETDKAAMDVPAIVGGRIESVLVKVGDKVSEGSSLAIIAARAGAVGTAAVEEKVAPPPVKAAAEAPPKPQAPGRSGATLPPINEVGFSTAHASPSVRKLARELGVDLAQVKGSGHKSRILHDDVKAFVKAVLTGQAGAQGAAALPKTPVVDFAKFGEIDLQPLTRIQKISGPRLQASWINIPHVTQHDLADITALEDKRQQLKTAARERGISLTPLAFVLKACVAALQEYPKVNASLADDGKNLVFKKYCHLGFAADTEQGLMVPVIRDADKKDVYELARELGELSQAARDGKLKGEQMQGATFTVSSLGGIGGTAFTPIVNAP
jgi:pyruvate dehydrogenase E2 component (dihydrolipoamide acetyltransferase)